MSEIISKAITCPKCNQKSTVDLMCSMNTESDPGVREKIFNGSLFRWKCKKCGFSTRLQFPVLYSDLKRQFMVYYIPNVERSCIVDEKLEKEFAELSDIRKRVVPTINALKEKIFLLEGGHSDLAVELSKLAVAEVVSKSTGQNVYEGYCTEINKEENSISFQFFLGEDHLQTTRYDVYKRSLGIVRQYFNETDKKKGFLNINRSWAREALKRYKTTE